MVRVVNDRRRLPRASQGGGVTLQTRRGIVAGTCLDVSAGGMAVLVPVAAKGRETVQIQAQAWGIPISANGRVVRCRPMLGVWFWGLRFADLDVGTRAALASHVQHQLTYAARVRQAELFAARLRSGTGTPSAPPRRPEADRVRDFAPIPMLDDRVPAVTGDTVVATLDDTWTREYTPPAELEPELDLVSITAAQTAEFDRATQVRSYPTLRVMVVPPNRARED